VSTKEALAQAVRQACIKAALEAYESAGISGLCADGRWEMAVQAIKALDLGPVIAGFEQVLPPSTLDGPDRAKRNARCDAEPPGPG
jgi:hypothetical protein